jgi:hypothetical protein
MRVAFERRRLVTILKEVPDAPVAAVEVQRVTGVDARHRARQWNPAGPHQEMQVIRHEREREHRKTALAGYERDPVAQVSAIDVVDEDVALGDAAKRHVVKDAWSIPARHAGHA